MDKVCSGEYRRKRCQVHQSFEESPLAMDHKFDDIIELPKSLPKKTNEGDLVKHMYHEQKKPSF